MFSQVLLGGTKKSSCPCSDGTWSHLEEKKGSFFFFSNLGFKSPFHLERPRRASPPVFYSLWSMCKHALPARLSASFHFSELMKLSEKSLVSFLCGSLLFPTAACAHNLSTLLLTHPNTAKRCKLQVVQSPPKPFFLLPGLFVPTSCLCLTAALCAQYVLFVGKSCVNVSATKRQQQMCNRNNQS